MTQFPFPVGILLFNSPEYSELVLASLANQTVPIDQSRMVIVIDGFSESRSAYEGHQNRVAEVEALARRYFPHAKIQTSIKNQGIAKQFATLESELFNFHNSEWAFFFEHDFKPEVNYLEALLGLIDLADPVEEIVQVNCTGDQFVPTSRGLDTLYPAGHAWSYGLRKTHAIERKEMMSTYLDVISHRPYFLRDQSEISAVMEPFGVFPIASSQDAVKQAIRHRFNKLSVTTGRHFGKYIGESGEHFNPETYKNLGYDNWDTDGKLPIITDLPIPELLPILFGEELNSLSRYIQQVQRDKSDLQTKLEQLERKIKQQQKEIKAHRNSLSWRVTWPLRAVTQQMKKLDASRRS